MSNVAAMMKPMMRPFPHGEPGLQDSSPAPDDGKPNPVDFEVKSRWTLVGLEVSPEYKPPAESSPVVTHKLPCTVCGRLIPNDHELSPMGPFGVYVCVGCARSYPVVTERHEACLAEITGAIERAIKVSFETGEPVDHGALEIIAKHFPDPRTEVSRLMEALRHAVLGLELIKEYAPQNTEIWETADEALIQIEKQKK